MEEERNLEKQPQKEPTKNLIMRGIGIALMIISTPLIVPMFIVENSYTRGLLFVVNYFFAIPAFSIGLILVILSKKEKGKIVKFIIVIGVLAFLAFIVSVFLGKRSL